MPRPVHFEIHAADPVRAQTFYATTFGWEFTKWEGPMPYWLVRTGKDAPGIDGGMMQRRGAEPELMQAVNAFVCTIDVPSLDDYLVKALKAGATVALPKMATPGIGWLAYIKDTEGNLVGMMQNDPSAK
jgi:predicted enzyme related to lactoylglutathione lyase